MTTATKWAVAVGVLALAAVVALLPRTDDTPETAQPPAPDLAPARAAAALPACPGPGQGTVRQLDGAVATCLADGRPVDLGPALADGPTLVNVWATWCQPCRKELPVLAGYAAEPGAVRVLGVQVASEQADGLRLLAELGVRLPSVHDGDGSTGPVREALRVPKALPASYLITADGQVKFIEQPRLFTDVASVRAAVDRYAGSST